MHDAALHPATARRRQHRLELQLAIVERLTLDQARERLASYSQHAPRLDADSEAATTPTEWPIKRTPSVSAEAPIAAHAAAAQRRFWWDDSDG